MAKGISLMMALVGGTVLLTNRRDRSKKTASFDVSLKQVKTIAHRGVSTLAPENTMKAFDGALELGCDFIELDVQMTADGKLVVIHDTTVDRTTNGTGRVRNLSWEELKQLDAGEWFSPVFRGEKIPLLEEVLDAYSGKIGLLIELKKPALYPGIIERIAALLRGRNLHQEANSPIIIQSFDFRALRSFHRILPEIPVGVLISRKKQMKRQVLQKFAAFADYVNPKHRLVDPESAACIHRLGMEMMAWSNQKSIQLMPLLCAGVDGIITDDPVFVNRGER
ncbi:MAG TPA: glycerophosphodiester phosphodiesterase family protein [Bacillales bacterium]|nr:glycerophosphodiester phosphodiesterase family protein [Bacillales bacterium]